MGLVSPERIVTVTHESHRFEAHRQLREIDPRLSENILAEPCANNTLPAIAWGTAEIAKQDPQALIGVFPSDHAIQGDEQFREDLAAAFRAASEGDLVTFGIRPSGPETGYGYIEAGEALDGGSARRVVRFVEKPDRATAERYLREGNYYWNSGMFVFRAKDFWEELKRNEPAIESAISRLLKTVGDGSSLQKIYPTIKKISIDYGIMERAKRVAVVPARFGWNDLGSWESLYQLKEKDNQGNAIEGDVLTLDTRSSLLISKDGHLAALGLEKLAVIKTGDTVLVAPRDRVQDVKKIVDSLKEKGSALVESHSTVHRPWGSFTVLEEGPCHKVKRIVVHPGQKLSLQSHRRRAEHWVVIEGTARVTNGEREFLLKQNESTFVPQGAKHRLENPGTGPLAIIEVQVGSYLGEDDIQRFDDIYGRNTTN
jgi:mannose-1-phosphate guanylyltransferase/mannose-6-phosphate isomerase